MNLQDVIEKIDEKSEDYSIPSRVRNKLKEISADLRNGEQDIAIRVTSAIYELDDTVNDINLPMHAKTVLWDILSDLEAIKEE